MEFKFLKFLDMSNSGMNLKTYVEEAKNVFFKINNLSIPRMVISEERYVLSSENYLKVNV